MGRNDNFWKFVYLLSFEISKKKNYWQTNLTLNTIIQRLGRNDKELIYIFFFFQPTMSYWYKSQREIKNFFKDHHYTICNIHTIKIQIKQTSKQTTLCFILAILAVQSERNIDTLLSEWVSDCCLMPTQQIFSYIMVRTS